MSQPPQLEPEASRSEAAVPPAIDPSWHAMLVESAPDAIVLINAAGTIILVNRQTERLFGYSRDELLGHPVECLVPEHMRVPHMRLREGFFLEPKVRDMGAGRELLGRRKDGSAFPIEISLSPLQTRGALYATAAIRDATERRRNNDKFKGLLETAPDAMVIIDQNGVIRLVNAQAERMFGAAREVLVGRPIEVLIPERLRERHGGHRSAFAEDPKVRPMGAGLDLWARRQDGTEFPVEISLSPLQSEEGTLITAAVRDISQRKQVERQLAEYAEHLERSNKELEQFAYVASHDLRAPLRSIIGFSQILQRRYAGKLDPEADEFLQYIVGSAADMQKLIDGLLAFSRVGRVGAEFSQVDMDALLERVVGQLRSVIEERGAQVTHDPLPRLRGSEVELGQLLQNLVSNGIKFQPGDMPRVHIGVAREGADWHFTVRDQGIGIDPRHQGRIFQIFQRLHPPDAYEGTGIGLAICKKIVTHHGGRIWVVSAGAGGTCFHFTLPADA